MPRHNALGLLVLSSSPDDRRKSPVTDREQIDACRRGDRAALDAVFRAHAEGIALLLRRIVGPSVEIDDLMQDTFATAITAFPTFRGEASVKTWLHRIAVHMAHRYLRKPRHRREAELVESRLESQEPAIDATVESRELAVHLYGHLDKLDATKRIALVLFAIEEHSIAEIAVLMGASKAATKSRLFWARRTLMKHMRKDPAFAKRGGDA